MGVDFRILEPAVKGEICSIHVSTVKGRRAAEYLSIGYKTEGCESIKIGTYGEREEAADWASRFITFSRLLIEVNKICFIPCKR